MWWRGPRILDERSTISKRARTLRKTRSRSTVRAGEHKRRVVYETGHNIPRPELIKETLGWLDKYFGTVSRSSEGSHDR